MDARKPADRAADGSRLRWFSGRCAAQALFVHRIERVYWNSRRPRRVDACDGGQSLSRGSPMVVLQQATEAVARHDTLIALCLDHYGQNQLVV
jgi:hypothetical protein